ncbi:UDP-glucose 6-dehydrogenase [Clostridium sp. AF19-22AC]|nr:UDP-glucose 6-dehydrogenase [Clostridium sp. AF19-22AC]
MVVIYKLYDKMFLKSVGANDLEKFKAINNAIITDSYDACMEDMKDNVYSRDIFQLN